MLSLKSIEEIQILDPGGNIIHSSKSEHQRRYNYILHLYHTNKLEKNDMYVIDHNFKEYYFLNDTQLVTKLSKHFNKTKYDFNYLLHYQLVLILLAFEKGGLWLRLLGDELPIDALTVILKVVPSKDRDIILMYTEEKKRQTLPHKPFDDTLILRIIVSIIAIIVLIYLILTSHVPPQYIPIYFALIRLIMI